MMNADDAPRPVRPDSGLLRPLSASRSRRSLTGARHDGNYEEAEQWRRQSTQSHSHHVDDNDDDDDLLLHQTVLASKKQQLKHQHERLAKQRAFIRHERRKLLLQSALLESERERFTASLASDWFCTAAFPTRSSRDDGWRVAVDVGGQLFEISRSVAAKDPGSLLAALFEDEDSPLAAHERGCFRVDRDWWLFRYVLRFLRDGILPPEPKLLRELYLESEFWRFESLRKAIEAWNMAVLQRRQEENDAIASAAAASLLASGTGGALSKEPSRRRESNAIKAKAATPRDPSAWWQEPPEWWGAPPKKESASATKGDAAASTTAAKEKEEPDSWWKTSTYKGTDYWHMLSPPSKNKPAQGEGDGADQWNEEAQRLTSERPLSTANGMPHAPLVLHSTWPSIGQTPN